ncbi:phenylacetate--CoA ligase family protein [Paenibacillus sp. YYML68]|uniref:phenylacetate--CoA ligase family protein n=1 Tax=Paenibacillus sp. YYML68 TaxID=2909250 RepID=UPI00248F4BE8|nr:AMP-binding protein [Paenibacillus sp. YYML68]
MKLSEDIARNMYWKLQDLRGKSDIAKRLQILRKTQHMRPEEIKTLQFDKLLTILKHAYNTVPYYKQIFQERGISPHDFNCFEDMQQIPLLTRDLLRSKQNELISTEADFATIQNNYSSGSTGVRAEFKQDLNFRLWMRAHQIRTYEWCNDWQLGNPFVLLWGSEIYWSYKRVLDMIDNFLTNRREFNTFNLSNDLINKFLDKLITFNPYLVSTYTNAMHLIAKRAEERNVTIKGLKAIQATSEPVPTAVRDRMKKVFGCEIYDKYGMRESNIISHESPLHDGMCIQSENVYVEFLKPDGSPCKYGEKGKVVVTTLNNLSMPLIRYETSDLAAPLAGYCSSGIGLPRMTSVTGRLQDLIISPTGSHIDAYFFSYLIMRYPQIHWFQVVQSELERLNIHLYAPNGIITELRNEIVERIHHHTGFPFNIEFELLSEMPISSTGKFRLCVSELGKSYSEIAATGSGKL